MSASKSSDKPKKIENTTERQVKSVSAPVAEPLSRDVLFQKKKVQALRSSGKTVEETEQTVVNIPVLQQHLFGEGRLKRVIYLAPQMRIYDVFLCVKAHNSTGRCSMDHRKSN